MKLKKLLLIALLTSVVAGFFSSCNPKDKKDETISGTWQWINTELWWVSPADPTFKKVQIGLLPSQTSTYTTPGTTNKTDVIYSGVEYDVTRTHKSAGNTLGTINYTWSEFPKYISPGQTFSCTIESKGTLGNGIGVSNSAYTMGGWPSGYGVWSQSFRNGPKTVQLTIPKPADVTVPSEMKFIVELSSGVEFYLNYYYVYRWNP